MRTFGAARAHAGSSTAIIIKVANRSTDALVGVVITSGLEQAVLADRLAAAFNA
jgi:hypothetical protein